jgi:hypothetical protein
MPVAAKYKNVAAGPSKNHCKDRTGKQNRGAASCTSLRFELHEALHRSWLRLLAAANTSWRCWPTQNPKCNAGTGSATQALAATQASGTGRQDKASLYEPNDGSDRDVSKLNMKSSREQRRRWKALSENMTACVIYG